MFKKKKAKDETGAQAEAPEGAEGADGEAVAADGKKKPPLKLILIAAAGAVFVLGGGGAGAYLFLGKKDGGDEHAAAEPTPPPKKGAGSAPTKGGDSPVTQGPDGVIFYSMPDMVVNIQSPDGRPTFLKLKLAFELPDQTVAGRLDPNGPRLADMFQTFLRELRPEDLSGSQGSYQLRMEILRRVNLVIAPSKVNAVLIQEMLIQ